MSPTHEHPVLPLDAYAERQAREVPEPFVNRYFLSLTRLLITAETLGECEQERQCAIADHVALLQEINEFKQ
jgi:hypothetical protein